MRADGKRLETESTAVDTNGREWRTRPVLARVVRLSILALPFLTVTAIAWELNHRLGVAADVVDEVATPTPTAPATTVQPTTTTSTTTLAAPASTPTTTRRPPVPAAPPTVPPPTTTGAAVTEVPTTTTTTLPPSTFDGGYLGAGGGGAPFGLVSSVGGSGAINWDSGAYDDPGLTLTSGPSGLIELDAPHAVAWVLPITRVAGTASLRLHVATPGFPTDSLGGVADGLSDCASLLASCTTIGAAQTVFSQEPFGNDFGAVTIDFSAVGHTLAPGHHLVVSMTVPQSMSTDTWIAFGTTDYPSRFRLV